MNNLTELEHCAELIFGDINMRTADKRPNQRAMVMLFVAKMIQVVIEMDMVDTYKPKVHEQAERTCKQEERGWGTEGDHARVWLTCGHDCMVPTVQDLPSYCPNCGARVIEE